MVRHLVDDLVHQPRLWLPAARACRPLVCRPGSRVGARLLGTRAIRQPDHGVVLFPVGERVVRRAIGENPARGVTMVIARRVTLVVYATIGLVLMTASETVQRARERARVAAPSPP